MKNGKKITVLDPMGQPSGIFGSRLNPDSVPWAIHDPVTSREIPRKNWVT